jgi:deoxyribodipyrimidine photolyase-related protein
MQAAAEVSLVFPHQLFQPHPALARDRPVYLVEDPLFFGTDAHWPLRFHASKLVLHRASMKAFATEIEALGHAVHYVECPIHESGDTVALLDQALPPRVAVVHACDPVDDVLLRRLRRFADARGAQLRLHASPGFLSPDAWMGSTLDAMNKPFLATFYAAQRKRMKLLLDSGGRPLGGKWSHDAENRRRVPRDLALPPEPVCAPTSAVREAQQYVRDRFPQARGSAEAFAYPVARADAEAWLDRFLDERLALFGDYEDAITTRHRTLFHSVLTPSLNIGLLDPERVVRRAVEHATSHGAPLNSIEGFVRQIIGWREFMRAMYLRHGVRERNANFWGFTHGLPAAFYDGTTGIEPVDHVIRRVHDHAYCHHIERLMVLGNFMLLCRIHPTAVYRWFMEMFIDAYDWVMVPNVYGMSQFADGGLFTTKPYLSGSNYIRKMSDFAAGPWCEIWDGLFWMFIDDHRTFFASNPRLGMMANQLKRMSRDTLDAHRARATAFLDRLHASSTAA